MERYYLRCFSTISEEIVDGVERSRTMRVISTAKISERHQQQMKERYSHVEFLFYDNIADLYLKMQRPFYEADILITYGEDLTEQNILDFPDLKWIQVISAGVEKMPLSTISQKQIPVTNARGIHKTPMGEYTIAVMLQIARKSIDLHTLQEKQIWDRTIRVDELANKTLGIIGFGAIGEAIAKRANAFEMKVIGVNSSGDKHNTVNEMYTLKEINEVLKVSDFVVICLPLTAETNQLINKEKLEQMKSNAWLINIARGGIVVEQDLIEVIKAKKIGGAVLDVFEIEPLPPGSPLWSMDNVIITPHLSGRSPYYMERALEIFYKNFDAFLASLENTEWLNLIDIKKGY